MLALNAGAVEIAALDEADKMLTFGFKPQLDRLRDILLPPLTGKLSTTGANAKKRPQVSWNTLQSWQGSILVTRPSAFAP